MARSVLSCALRGFPLYTEWCQRPCVAEKKETPAVSLPLRGFREAYPPKIEIATSINLMIFVTNSITAEAQLRLLVTIPLLVLGSWPGVFSSLLRGAHLLNMTYLLRDVRGPHVIQNGVCTAATRQKHTPSTRESSLPPSGGSDKPLIIVSRTTRFS